MLSISFVCVRWTYVFQINAQFNKRFLILSTIKTHDLGYCGMIIEKIVEYGCMVSYARMNLS